MWWLEIRASGSTKCHGRKFQEGFELAALILNPTKILKNFQIQFRGSSITLGCLKASEKKYFYSRMLYSACSLLAVSTFLSRSS